MSVGAVKVYRYWCKSQTENEAGYKDVLLRQQAPPLPDLRRTGLRGTEGRNAKLFFLDFVDEFNSADRNGCVIETLEP